MVNDILDIADSIKLRTYSIILDPHGWHNFNPAVRLDWKCVKFEVENISNIPAQAGIYAFVVKFYKDSNREVLFPSHGVIVYGGITGYKESSDRTLRKRFEEYLNEKGKRMNIYKMIRDWGENLYFFYSEILPEENVDMLMLEKQFNDAVQPIVARNDFSANVRTARKLVAFQ